MKPLPVSLPVVAAFDFDGTLSYHDTLLPFLRFVKGDFATFGHLALTFPYLAKCLFKMTRRQDAKEAVIRQFFKEMPLSQLENYGKRFAEEKLSQYIKPEALKCLKKHQEQGHRCILVSANLDVYLNPWARAAGFHDIITSRLEIEHGRVTGRLRGKNVWGDEKARLLLELLGPKKEYTLYAYGDSQGDKELLLLADKPFYRSFS